MENEPAKHSEQDVDDAEAEYVPAEQLEQAVAEVTEYIPAAHAPVTVDRPVVAQYDPAVHSVHAVSPSDAEK